MKVAKQNTWLSLKLKYVASINDETLSEDTDPGLEIKYIDIGNVNASGNIDTPVTYRFENAPSRARRIVQSGDVIISTVRTYLKAIAPIENAVENLIVSTGFAVVRPQPNRLNANFCKYLLRENSFIKEVVKRSVGVSYPAINSSELGNIEIQVPPVQNQRNIATYLDRETDHIDQLIAAKEKLLALLEEKRKAMITRAVTRGLDPNVKMKNSGVEWLGEVPKHWEVTRIKFITTKIGSGVTPRGGGQVYQKKGIPFLRSQNIHFNGLQLEDVVYIPEEIHESMSNSKVEQGDVLLNITGASIGRCYFYEGQFGEMNVNQHVCILRPNTSIKTKFLYLYISSEVGQHQITLNQTGGGREGLNFESLKAFFITLPLIQEQRLIIDFVEIETAKFQKLKKAAERTIELLKERRSAMISAAVTGQIEIPES